MNIPFSPGSRTDAQGTQGVILRGTVLAVSNHRHRSALRRDRPRPAVSFEPGAARTAWHTHPLGPDAVCHLWRRAGPRPREVRWSVESGPATSYGFRPGRKNIGMAPRLPTAMTHIAMQESPGRKVYVTWIGARHQTRNIPRRSED